MNMTENLKFVLGMVENMVGKGENAGYKHVLLFSQCFQKAFFPVSLNDVILWYRRTAFFAFHALAYLFSNYFSVTQGPKSFTPVKSFIFSPPIQHTKSRLEQHHTDGVNDDNEQAEALPDSSESEPKIEPKNTRKTRFEYLFVL